MQDLVKQEQFELEVLEKLNSNRLLSNFVFVGGTMLRLCYGLNRFSVDLDFWSTKKDADKYFLLIKQCLKEAYTLTDSANKHFTMLFELQSAQYPRSLKIEIRKEQMKLGIEQAIAFSPFVNTQVKVNVLSLQDMMRAKIDALLSRKQIRDAFDIEFLVRKGIGLGMNPREAKKAQTVLDGLKKNDYQVVLGSLLEAKERAYYSKEGFKLLRSKISEIL